jgi:hypothetical protein
MTNLFVISPDVGFMQALYRQCAGSRLQATNHPVNSDLITYQEKQKLKMIRHEFWNTEEFAKKALSADNIMLIDLKLAYQNDKEWRKWLETSYPEIVTEAVRIATHHQMKIILAQPIIAKLGRVDWFNQHRFFFKHLVEIELIDQERMIIIGYHDNNLLPLVKDFL